MKANSKPGPWEPVSRGKIFCSSACGGHCTMAQFKAAHASADKLIKRLSGGSRNKLIKRLSRKDPDSGWRRYGWTKRVWENLGWYSEVQSPCKRLRVHGPGRYATCSFYSAYLGDIDSSGGKWCAQGKTPEEAIRKVIAIAKHELAKMGALLTGL